MAKYLDSTGLTHLWAKIKSYVATYITNLNLGGTYVAKETGKGLSTNDYTTAEKNKLSGIAAGAEVNVNADWEAASGDAQILNKPSIPSKTSDLTNDSGFITSSDIPEGAAASNTTPLMDGTAAKGSETAFARGDHRHPTDTSRQAVISDLATIRSGASAGATAYQKPSTGIPETDLAQAVKDKLTAASNAIPSSQIGVPGGVVDLDENGLIDSSYLPSFVDDVIEAWARSGATPLSENWLTATQGTEIPIEPTSGKIYVLMADSGDYTANSQFRWGGTTYVKLNDGGVSAITNAEIDSITSN